MREQSHKCSQQIQLQQAAHGLSRGSTALRDRISRGISTAMEKGTVSALWNKIISNEVTISTARFWWLHKCLLPLLGKRWLRGRLSVSNARSQCAVNKVKVSAREESWPSAAEQFCSKQVDFSLLRQQEFQALSPLSLQHHLQCVTTWKPCVSLTAPWSSNELLTSCPTSPPEKENGCHCFSAWLPRGGWLSLFLLITELFFSCPHLPALLGYSGFDTTQAGSNPSLVPGSTVTVLLN